MAKNAKTAAAKGRETKLGKKSAEELIQIILRKDKTEKNLSAQVVNLKSEINALTSRINNFDKDQEGNINEIKRLRENNKTNRETIDGFRIRVKEYEEDYLKENKLRIELEEKVKSLKKVIIVSLGFAALCFICLLLS